MQRNEKILKRVSEMTVEQKLGHLIVCQFVGASDEEREFLYDKIKRGCIGAMYVTPDKEGEHREEIKMIKEMAPNTILFCADMETGFPGSDYKLPPILSIAMTDSEELAYHFGKVTAVEAKRAGFNTIWGPVVDYADTDAHCKIGRCVGSDVNRIAQLAGAVARAYKDEGMFFTVKHFPGASDITEDNHMFKCTSKKTEEEFLSQDIVPYKEMLKNDLLPGVMIGHVICDNVDPDNTASMSPRMHLLLRNEGFDGMFITDSFTMQGLRQKYGEKECHITAVKVGNDLIIPNFACPIIELFDALQEAYDRGEITDERLDDAVYHIVKAQEMTLKEPKHHELSAEDIRGIDRIYNESVALYTADGVETKLTNNKKRLFVILTPNIYLNNERKDIEILLNYSWNVEEIKNSVSEKFPDAQSMEINEYPNSNNIKEVCDAAGLVDEVVWITYCQCGSYYASDELTRRICTVMRSMQEKLAAVIHMGNPYAMEDIPHSKRILFTFSDKSIPYALDILNGEAEAKGKIPFKLDLK